jgi:hypothetical protein
MRNAVVPERRRRGRGATSENTTQANVAEDPFYDVG